MILDALAQAPLAVQVHLATVMPAFAIGSWQIFISKKGARVHRALGFVYLALMTVTAGAAFFIRGRDGSKSPIHLFIPLAFLSVIVALWCVRIGRIDGHKRAMLGLHFGGILIAGTLAFMPGRLMHQLVFGLAP